MADIYRQLRRTFSTVLDGGCDVRSLPIGELRVRQARAWDANQGDDLQKLDAEIRRRINIAKEI